MLSLRQPTREVPLLSENPLVYAISTPVTLATASSSKVHGVAQAGVTREVHDAIGSMDHQQENAVARQASQLHPMSWIHRDTWEKMHCRRCGQFGHYATACSTLNIDWWNRLTYIDVQILERGGGGGGGGGKGGGGRSSLTADQVDNSLIAGALSVSGESSASRIKPVQVPDQSAGAAADGAILELMTVDAGSETLFDEPTSERAGEQGAGDEGALITIEELMSIDWANLLGL